MEVAEINNNFYLCIDYSETKKDYMASKKVKLPASASKPRKPRKQNKPASRDPQYSATIPNAKERMASKSTLTSAENMKRIVRKNKGKSKKVKKSPGSKNTGYFSK